MRMCDEHSVIDATGLTVVPGFIDIHAHGGGGCDIEDGNFESLEKCALPMQPRYHGNPPCQRRLLEACFWKSPGCSGVIQVATSSAEVLGIHLEGPWLNPKMKGAQPLSGIRRPSIDELDRLIDHRPVISGWLLCT